MKVDQEVIKTCFHCGENCSSGKIFLQEKQFCCDGCKLVYELLNENDLCTYYNLNSNPGISQKIKIREDKFLFLEDVEVKNKLIQFTDGSKTHVTFYLPQIHCSSCLWLLENIHNINKGIVHAKVNFINKEVFIIFSEQETSLRKVVETLTYIGYEPHISLQELDENKLTVVNHKQLYKIGIAGFCFVNIMMMSLPEYFSSTGKVEDNIHQILQALVVVFSLPVIFYCASDFFITAWKGLRNKFLNIDTPIALAILITFCRSIYEIFSGTGTGYLDSMSGIVFFMLIGRMLQQKTYHSISFERDYKSFFPVAINVLKDNVAKPTIIHNVKVGDVIQIYNNELIPVDAILSKGNASIDYSFVSGESLPVAKEIGEIIYAGGKQLNGILELIVVKEVSQSYLTNLWNKDVFKTQSEEQEQSSFIHWLSKYFTFIVLSVAFIAAAYWLSQHQYNKMWNTLTTVLIVACPCALLLASTFTNGNILRILSKNKLYLRHADMIERLTKINHVVFDKTGTITEQKTLQIEYQGNPFTTTDKINIASIMLQSSHPLSKAIVEYLHVLDTIEIHDLKIIHGRGVEAWINDRHYKIGSYDFIQNAKNISNIELKSSSVFVMIDNKVIGDFKINQQYRFGLKELIQQLRNKFAVSIISGDNNSEKQQLQTIFGQETSLLFNQKPAQKFDYIEHLKKIKHQNVLFIGDGLNDAGALKAGNIGIAITENANNFTPSCDGILDASQFSNLYSFIQLAVAGNNIILLSFMLSIIYNVIGLYFAVQGTLSPLIAAILMPCSSITIVLITYGLTQFHAIKLKLQT